MAASWDGRTAIVKALLDKGADVNARNGKDAEAGATALMYAAAEGHTDTVRILIDRGADVNARRESGGTALSLATELERTEIISLLKKAGATE